MKLQGVTARLNSCRVDGSQIESALLDLEIESPVFTVGTTRIRQRLFCCPHVIPSSGSYPVTAISAHWNSFGCNAFYGVFKPFSSASAGFDRGGRGRRGNKGGGGGNIKIIPNKNRSDRVQTKV